MSFGDHVWVLYQSHSDITSIHHFLYQFLSKAKLSQINLRKKRQCLQANIYTYITSGSGSILWWKHVYISSFTFDRTTWVNQRNRNYRTLIHLMGRILRILNWRTNSDLVRTHLLRKCNLFTMNSLLLIHVYILYPYIVHCCIHMYLPILSMYFMSR